MLGCLLHEWPPFLQGFRREVPVDDLAHLQMVRTVVFDELVTSIIAHVFEKTEVRLIDRRIGWSRVVLEDGGGEQLVMPADPDQIVVTRYHPQLVLFVPMHRVFVAQLAIITIGISDDVRSEHVVLKRSVHDDLLFSINTLRAAHPPFDGAPAIRAAAAFGRRLARAARPTPMLPSAPPTFSMMTGCPSDALIRSATIRPVTSPGPKPAAEGMITVMGRAG